MSASLPEVLLRIAAAVAADGGAGVRKALEDALLGAMPFDAGELAFVRGHGDTWRQPLGATEGPILGRDLLEHVLAHGASYRIDDWRDAEPFVETLGLLRARALRSLLTVPFRFEASGVPPVTGALAIGRSHGWGFVGASLPLFVPLASMAGLAFDRALALTTLRERAQALESVSPRTHGIASSRTSTLREAREKSRELHLRAEAAEARCLLAERSRDDWAQEAAALRARTEEQGAEIQSLRRGMAGARETAVEVEEAARRVASLEDELRRTREESAELAREAQAERAGLERETTRLEGERVRLEEALKQAEVELEIALDQIGALSPPASAPVRSTRR